MTRFEKQLPLFALEALEESTELTENAEAVAQSLALLGELLSAPEARPGAKARLLDRIHGGERFAPFFARVGELFDLSVNAVAELFQRAEDAVQWQPGPVPGVTFFHLIGGPRVASADCGLVRVAPGTHFPMHVHTGGERNLILEGSGRDEDSGAIHRAGDAVDFPAGSPHAFEALPGPTLLFAVVLPDGIEIGGRKYGGKSGF